MVVPWLGLASLEGWLALLPFQPPDLGAQVLHFGAQLRVFLLEFLDQVQHHLDDLSGFFQVRDLIGVQVGQPLVYSWQGW